MKLSPIKIHSIKRIPNPDKDNRTWDLQVAEDHTYLIGTSIDNHVVSHNTEIRLDRFGENVFFRDIDKDTVDFVQNYTGEFIEPKVLPAIVPNLLVNGSSGIAVGLATNVLPHNSGEIIDAMVEMIDGGQSSTIEDIMKHIKGPDFPMGGLMKQELSELRSSCEDGTGKFVVRGRAEFESHGNRHCIIIREIPWKVNKAELIEHIIDLAETKEGINIPGIKLVRDESAKDEIRIMIELEHKKRQQSVLNALYRHTVLETAYSLNLTTIHQGRPRQMGIFRVLRLFLDWRSKVVLRKIQYELNQLETRRTRLDAMMRVYQATNKVIKIIKDNDGTQAKLLLVSEIGLNSEQADFTMQMPLGRLSKIEHGKMKNELKDVKSKIVELSSVLKTPAKLWTSIREELIEFKKNYSTPRKTTVVKDFERIDMIDTVPKEDVVAILTNRGRMNITSTMDYRTSKRAAKGFSGLNLDEETGEVVEGVYIVHSHDIVQLFTDKGNFYTVAAHEFPITKRMQKPVPVASIFPEIGKGEKVVALVTTGSMSEEIHEKLGKKQLLILMAPNLMKKVSLDKWRRGRTNRSAPEGYNVLGVHLCDEGDDVLLVAQSGKGVRFPVTNIRSLGSRSSFVNSSGVLTINIEEDDNIIGFDLISHGKQVVTISENGIAKRMSESLLPCKIGRRGKGYRISNINKKTGKIIYSAVTTDNTHIVLVTKSGKLIKFSANQIPERTIRTSTGCKIQNLNKGDSIRDAAGYEEVL